MSRLPIWWPVRAMTLVFLAMGMGAAIGGRWRVGFAALIWLVTVLFLELTRPDR